MATHNQLGKTGEALAASYLRQLGFTILHSNWRHSHYEIDIIASLNNILHFIEVKTRSGIAFGYPEQSVTKQKFIYLQNAADEYLHLHPSWEWIQFDILSIIIHIHQPPEFFFIEDVFL